jgi:hypothetical protein
MRYFVEFLVFLPLKNSPIEGYLTILRLDFLLKPDYVCYPCGRAVDAPKELGIIPPASWHGLVLK